MNPKLIVGSVQILISVLLAFCVLIQVKGYGLSSGITTFYRSKRGFEKIVFIVTIILGILFALNSIILIKFV